LESLKASRVESFESEPIMVSPKSLVSEVIGVLESNDAYEAFAQEGDKVNTITMREILRASDISSMRASSLMLYVSKLSPSDTVGKAARLMSDYRLRALPIVRGRAIEGEVTAKSLCQALLTVRGLRDIRVNKIMKRKLITVTKGESVSKARSLMLKNDVDHLPVLDSGGLCGVLLSNHVVLFMLPKEGLEKGTFVSKPSRYLDLKVSGLMDSDALVCDPKERASDALRRMMEQGKTYSIVKLWDELQGIVTYRDFVVLLAEQEDLEIPAYIVGLPDDPYEAELARMKFTKGAKSLCKAFPGIEEIRSTVKTKEISDYRRRYEVSVAIRSSGEVHAYSEDGWDLPSIFDSIADKMKRLLTKKQVRRSPSIADFEA